VAGELLSHLSLEFGPGEVNDPLELLWRHQLLQRGDSTRFGSLMSGEQTWATGMVNRSGRHFKGIRRCRSRCVLYGTFLFL
jgi:hypothetical protein